MKLLVITQSVDLDDPILGFFHRWLQEFATNCETVNVICLRQGRYDLPANVRVFSLGKEQGIGKAGRLVRFYSLIWSLRKEYQAVFVHMNPIYVALGGWFWKLQGKRIGLWYTHRQVTLLLKFATCLSDIIFTASSESFRLKSNKIRVLGHGIDLDGLAFKPRPFDGQEMKLLHLGRITKIKNLDVLIEAARMLQERGLKTKLTFIGSPATHEDEAYAAQLRSQTERSGLVQDVVFAGSMPHAGIRDAFYAADISVNLCPTGGVDKAVLESMACGTPVVASNLTFAGYFGDFKDRLLFGLRDSADLADKIFALASFEGMDDLRLALRRAVEQKADVGSLVKKIVESYG